MRIVNRTRYDTRVIRQLLNRTHRYLAKTEGRLHSWSALRVEVDPGRPRYSGDGCHGHASLSGYHMHLFLRLNTKRVVRNADGEFVEHPDAQARRQRGQSGFKKELVQDPVRGRDAAWLVFHEMMHNYGFKHGQFDDAKPDDLDAICRGLPELLPLREPKRQSPLDLVAARREQVAEKLRSWQRRLKYAQGKVKAYQRKARYYERKEAASEAMSSREA